MKAALPLALLAFALAPLPAVDATHCPGVVVTDDGAHGVTESGGTVYVNGAGVKHTCLVTVIVPENVYLP